VSSLGVQPILEAVFEQLDTLLPKKGIETAENLRKELERNLRAGLEAKLQSLNLVSRNEFEVQQAVLARAQQQLQDMAAQITALETQIEKN